MTQRRTLERGFNDARTKRIKRFFTQLSNDQ